MSSTVESGTREILLVEDSPGDIRLIQEAFGQTSTSLHLNVVTDGVEAMSFLRREGSTQTPRARISSCWILIYPEWTGERFWLTSKGTTV